MNLEEKLIEAAKTGKTEEVKKLLKAGADIHAERDQALRYAANNDHTETVKLLLERGADIHAQEDAALRWAAINGHTETCKLLLTHYKTTELKTLLEREDFPQDLIQKEIQTRNTKLAQKAKTAEQEMEI